MKELFRIVRVGVYTLTIESNITKKRYEIKKTSVSD
jgi:hypothetical protein